MHATTGTSFGAAGSLEQFDAQSGSMLERAGLWAKWVPAPGGVSVVGGFD